MAFVSLTRLRIRSLRFMPLFAIHTWTTFRQVRKSSGFQAGAVLPDAHRTFWTLTAWNSEESMRAYMISGSHKRAMPHLMHWCDEASVAHWQQDDSALPSWPEADTRMRETGRVSKVLHPSPNHQSLAYEPPDPSRSSSFGPL